MALITGPKYRFSKNKARYNNIIRFFDGVCKLFSSSIREDIDTSSIKSICFVQLAHLGDFIMMLPTMHLIKKHLDVELTLVSNTINNDLAAQIPYIDRTITINHPSFSRNGINGNLTSLINFRDIKADLLFEVRGDIRIIPFLKILSQYKYLVGFDSGGAGFLLDSIMEYPFETHITNTYNKIRDFIHLSHLNPIDFWTDNLLPIKPCQVIFDDYICINVGVGSISRDWEWMNFVNLIKKLSLSHNIVIIGKETDNKTNFYKYYLENNANVQLMLNKTSITESIYLIKRANYYIGLDSGFTHISALLGKKTLAIFSDATDENVWKPIELFKGQLAIVKKNISCGNCGRLDCDNNICMKQITVDEVYRRFLNHIT